MSPVGVGMPGAPHPAAPVSLDAWVMRSAAQPRASPRTHYRQAQLMHVARHSASGVTRYRDFTLHAYAAAVDVGITDLLAVIPLGDA